MMRVTVPWKSDKNLRFPTFKYFQRRGAKIPSPSGVKSRFLFVRKTRPVCEKEMIETVMLAPDFWNFSERSEKNPWSKSEVESFACGIGYGWARVDYLLVNLGPPLSLFWKKNGPRSSLDPASRLVVVHILVEAWLMPCLSCTVVPSD